MMLFFSPCDIGLIFRAYKSVEREPGIGPMRRQPRIQCEETAVSERRVNPYLSILRDPIPDT
jgi:hypothetical protein